jgi:hypothetical protein
MSVCPRKDWAAWRMDDEVRVQVNRPDIAREFAKVKSVRRVGYSVCGKFTRLFHVQQSVPWVEEWMENFVRNSKPQLN